MSRRKRTTADRVADRLASIYHASRAIDEAQKQGETRPYRLAVAAVRALETRHKLVVRRQVKAFPEFPEKQ